jgi:hypothetical protein
VLIPGVGNPFIHRAIIILNMERQPDNLSPEQLLLIWQRALEAAVVGSAVALAENPPNETILLLGLLPAVAASFITLSQPPDTLSPLLNPPQSK